MAGDPLTERVVALEAFRDEVRQEFVETRKLIREGDEETRRQMREGDEETRRQMREGDEETRRQMRLLHEDLVERIKNIGEGVNGDNRTKSRRRKS